MHVQFKGAARTVTGSMHLVSVGGRTILLDCGIYHGKRDESRERNCSFPFDPTAIDAVVLSHALIDHTGNLPTLVQKGFHGPIYCTDATKNLCEIMLRDSAFIQERDAEFVSRKHHRTRLPPVTPLYTEKDVDNTLPLLRGLSYSLSFDVTDGIECRSEDAGHILGSASVALTLREKSKTVRLAFTADYLISESTYGGRFHAPVAKMKDQLLGPILRAHEREKSSFPRSVSVARRRSCTCFTSSTGREQSTISRFMSTVPSR